jgi:glycerol-3-phosphate acyltransferase PlsY
MILTRLAVAPDIRSIASVNIGATNVLRTGRKRLAAATLLFDMLKGFAVVLVTGHLFGPSAGLIAGFGAFVGHLFPIWLRFKGGKGVATYIGVLLAIAWPIALAFCALWLSIAAAARYSSLAALTASAGVPFALWLYGKPDAAVLFAVLTVMLWLMHRANIRRLLEGSETKIALRRHDPP